jgi:hypothetical protein
MQGSPPGGEPGPHLVRYELNGDLAWEAPVPSLVGLGASDFCPASDFGYLVLTHGPDPLIVHVDSLGQSQWVTEPTGVDQVYGNSINPTMDGGFVYAGENRPLELNQTGSGYSFSQAGINKFNGEGELQWWHKYTYCHEYESARQLSQGGYIAAGCTHDQFEPRGSGVLVRYAAETGMGEEATTPGTLELTTFPNPFASDLRMRCTLPGPGSLRLSVQDLSGRRIAVIGDAVQVEETSSFTWVPDPTLPNGCYLIVLQAGGGQVVRDVVLLR